MLLLPKGIRVLQVKLEIHSFFVINNSTLYIFHVVSTEFVMKDAPSCTLEIYLSNFNGTLSKKKYGNVIGLKRCIVKKGSPRHLVRHRDPDDPNDLKGIWVALKKNSIELELILSSLRIDYKNPLQAFTQEDSLNFLKTKDPAKLYL